MGCSRFEARDHSTGRSLRLGRAPGRRLPGVHEGSRAGGCSGAAGGARSTRASLAIRGPGVTFRATRRPAGRCPFWSRSPFGPALATRGARAAFHAARRSAGRCPFRTWPLFGSDAAGSFRGTVGRVRAPSAWAFCSARDDDPARRFDPRAAGCRADRGGRRGLLLREGRSSPLERAWRSPAARSGRKAPPSPSAVEHPGS